MPPGSTAAPSAASASLDAVESAFARRALRRRPLFLGLSIFGIAVAAGLSCYYVWRRMHDPLFPVAARAVIVVLVLLNARQNLRQYRFAGLLGKVLPPDFGGGAGPGARA
jgi:CHASE2 domain-containing sensor protein